MSRRVVLCKTGKDVHGVICNTVREVLSEVSGCASSGFFEVEVRIEFDQEMEFQFTVRRKELEILPSCVAVGVDAVLDAARGPHPLQPADAESTLAN